MNWSQKEKVIREKRTMEATAKNLMGITGKMGMIVKTFGYPIVRQSGFMDVNVLEDPYDFVDSEHEQTASGQNGPEMWRDEILDMGDDYSQDEGFVFDGLSRGMHLEIKFWHHNQKLEVSYKGYEVYKEISGELYAYAPSDDWESLINRLYKIAKEESNKRKRHEEIEIGEEIERKKETFWRRLQRRWGVQ